METKKLRKYIKDNLVFIGTSTKDGLPNITVVDRPLLLDDGRILVADVMMTCCRENLLSNPSCSMVVFDYKDNTGLKFFGKANYFTSGQEIDLIQKKLEGSGYEARGAFAVTVEKIVEIK